MKIFSLLALLLMLGAAPMMAQTAASAVTEQNSRSIDPAKTAVRSYLNHMYNNYSLSHDQQLALKKSGVAFSESIQSANSQERRASLERGYINSLRSFLNDEQFEDARNSQQVLSLIADIVRHSSK